MPVIVATQIRVGNLLEIDGGIYRVAQMDHVTPGKGRGHVQVKMKHLETGTSKENRFRSDEKVTKVHLDQRTVQYLYKDADHYTFMDNKSYEQISLPKEMLEEAGSFLTENLEVTVSFYQERAVGIELPVAVDLRVESTGDAIKGATATNQFKPATLETGLVVQVPPFIKEGETIKIETATGKYLERA